MTAERTGWHKGVELKSARELALMREAGRIAALALAEMRDKLKPGVTGKQLDAMADKVIAQHGATPAFKGAPGPYPYPFATTISINEQLVHGLPTGRVIRDGDVVSLDCGVLHHGLYADNAVTVGVGRISSEAARLLEVTEQALYKGIAQACAGNRVGDISHAIQEYVEQHGYYLTRDYTGHGVGRHMHEDPEVPNLGKPRTGRLLRPGLVIAIEPMVLVGTDETMTQPDGWTVVAVDGSLACHFEHTVAITEGEPEILTKV
ncbi:MAG: type I methionyl aminopeptidase [Anaerolineales bacterium]